MGGGGAGTEGPARKGEGACFGRAEMHMGGGEGNAFRGGPRTIFRGGREWST